MHFALALAFVAATAAPPPDEEMRTYREIRAFAADPAKVRQKLREFIARPEHKHPEILGSVYTQLFRVEAGDPRSSAEDLADAIRGMDRYEESNFHIKYAMAAETLADRGIELAYAEDLARRGIPAMERYMEEGRADYGTDYERNAKFFNAQMHDALGWVLIREGKRREGEAELRTAYRLNPDDPHVLYHRGRLAEQDHDMAAAERWYARGVVVQTSRTNPNSAALEAVYQERHGSLAGFNADLARLRDADTRSRRGRVLAARLSPPRAVPSFALATLDGAKVSLDALRGKIVVINFWGLWCGWCLREMPDFAGVRRRYRSDPRVAILTIDTNDDPAKVRRWMSEQRYEFPVLLDAADYAKGAGIRTYPTTWFLDRRGRLVFEKIGFSYKLPEEFGWRVDALLQSGRRANPRERISAAQARTPTSRSAPSVPSPPGRPDGKRIVFVGHEGNRPLRTYLFDGGRVTAITPEGRPGASSRRTARPCWRGHVAARGRFIRPAAVRRSRFRFSPPAIGRCASAATRSSSRTRRTSSASTSRAMHARSCTRAVRPRLATSTPRRRSSPPMAAPTRTRTTPSPRSSSWWKGFASSRCSVRRHALSLRPA